MAKKKTKKTGAKPVGDARSKLCQLAAERIIRWQRLRVKLSEIQGDAHRYFAFGRDFTAKEIDAEYARHPTRYRHGREDADWHLVRMDRLHFAEDLRQLTAHAEILGDAVADHQRIAVATLARLAMPDVRGCSDPILPRMVADALRVAEIAIQVDGVSKSAEVAHRKPSPLEAAILDVLLDADGSLSAEEIASRVQRKLGKSKIAKAILDAIGKLRADCGFDGLYAGDAGFKLTPDQRALAAKIRARSE